ncbi:MAG: hypothetical protein QXZ62_07870, partial [Candidatus Caldarchaeum sp.]
DTPGPLMNTTLFTISLVQPPIYVAAVRAPIYQQACPSGLKDLLVKPFTSTTVSVKPEAS